jgi:hypothetical protein
MPFLYVATKKNLDEKESNLEKRYLRNSKND